MVLKSKLKFLLPFGPRTLNGAHKRFILYLLFMEEGMATHSSILAWEIPWTEEPVGLQSILLQRVTHD